MDRRTSLLASMSLAMAFGAAALMGAAPPPDGQGAGTPPAKGTDKDGSHDGHKHEKGERREGKKGATVGQKAPDFKFTDANGKAQSLADFAGKTVVLEWINPGCPVCKGKMTDGSVAKMITNSKAADSNVVFIFVNSTESAKGGSAESSAKYLKENKIDAITFWEGDGTVGRLYGAQTTPHLFVIDGKGVLQYSGAIDDAEAEKKGTNYVVEAVKAIKAGNTPSPSSTRPYGCSVKYASSKKSTN